MKQFLPMLLASALLAVPLLPAVGANLRPMTTLQGEIVHLSDLFDDAGPDASRVLGPAPAPGGRIVVEAPQLAAIARRFAVSWQPVTPSDRIVLDRPGRLLPREDMLAALRQALAGVGAPSGEIETPGFVSPLVSVAGHPQAAFEQLDYDAASGRFTGLLAITGDAMAMQRMRVSGTLQEMIELPVLTRRLLPGAVIQPGDLQIARIRAGLARGEVAHTASQAVGLALRHITPAGQPLALAGLVRPPTVFKGARVTIMLQAAGLSLSAQGQALENGSIGERIPVLNPSSRAVVEADVTGPDQVRVVADATALAEARPARPGTAFAASGFTGRILQ